MNHSCHECGEREHTWECSQRDRRPVIMRRVADLTTPAEIVRNPTEAEHQAQCVDWMRRRGYWARKFSSMTQRSVPDYLFARTYEDNFALKTRYEIKFATEFKRPGAKRDAKGLMSTEAQQDEQNAMRAAGWYVFENDNFDEFKKTVIAYEASCA